MPVGVIPGFTLQPDGGYIWIQHTVRGMARERIQTRDDRDVKAAVEQMAEDKEISEAEAVRRLVRTGLAVQGYDSPDVVKVGSSTVERLAEREGYSKARVNETARVIGGLLLGLSILYLLFQVVV